MPSWHALVRPRGLPDGIRDRLAREMREILFAPAMRERLPQLGAESVASDPAGLVAWTAVESNRYGELVRRLGIRGE